MFTNSTCALVYNDDEFQCEGASDSAKYVPTFQDRGCMECR